MREIKFRAWDKKENKWYKPIFEAYKSNLLELLVSFNSGLVKRTMSGVAHESLFPDQYVLMQYTGLYDKDGKEIYEGDVVKILHGEWMSQHLGNDEQKAMTPEQYLDSLTKQYEVVFATDRFMGKRHIGYNPWETDQEGYTYTRLTPDRHGYVEIIGNIYENPELLAKE